MRRYDWRRRRGDVLRSLYEHYVGRADRKAFGEFYTPDWLAEKMVEEVLDDEWLETAIHEAEEALSGRSVLRNRGLLDPTCGSGTFLYFAAHRLLEAPAMRDLQPAQRSDVAALLLNGIDVHPVAVEIAKTNLMRVITPTEGESALRIHLGDSLLIGDSELFDAAPGLMRLPTPGGRAIMVPMALVERIDFPEKMRRVVRSAVCGKAVPPSVLSSVPESSHRDLVQMLDDLVAVIKKEGNSVWTWYAVNRSGPHLLSQRKVDRVVANPPWVKLATIQDLERKRTLERFGRKLGIQAGGNLAPHLDVASFFVLRSRELFLADPSANPAIWLVKKSALKSSQWASFRQKHASVLAQTVDLEVLKPFGGGDARKCCLLMECRPSFLVDGTRATKRVEACLTPKSKGLAPDTPWLVAKERIVFRAASRPLPQAPSDYKPGTFRQGATIVPHVLVVAERVAPHFADRVLVRTRRSTQLPWKNVAPQDVEVPQRWLSNVHRSTDLLSFFVEVPEVKRPLSGQSKQVAVVPRDETGRFDVVEANRERDWRRMEDLYQLHRGEGRATPKTLVARIDYQRSLSRQPTRVSSSRLLVLYPTSGDIMRAARTYAGRAFVDSTLYWHVAATEAEAGYLTSILNAPSLERAFRESRKSGRDFHQFPWRNVPIPRFDARNSRHVSLVQSCARAEAAAEFELKRVTAKHATAKQVKCSKAIRKRLDDLGISSEIDKIVAKLMPDQCASTNR